jgi:hypothetical protein
VAQQLDTLQAAGLVACRDGRRYAPASLRLHEMCERLEAAYRERSGQVIRAIATGPNNRLQIFGAVDPANEAGRPA